MVRCHICRRPLRSKESIDRGIGPTCAKHIPYKDISKIEREDVRYWIQEAYTDLATSYFLKRGGKKLESAFFAHLAVEKAIKSLVAQNTNRVPPKIHNLKFDRISQTSKLTPEPRTPGVLAHVERIRD
ncbi:MAG: DUF6011 domain-containing protein [Alicyclobacillus sp.]|nr:DUF6011 domain-containing protein [Alicyclobacillus sp.]